MSPSIVSAAGGSIVEVKDVDESCNENSLFVELLRKGLES